MKLVHRWGKVSFLDAFLQYLWGIETSQTQYNRQSTCISFYSTYEELKPLPRDPFFLFIFCFYSTYEELKLGVITFIGKRYPKFLQYLWGIETRYRVYLYLCCGAVFTVPMRNWNWINSKFDTGSFCFYSTYEELKPEFSIVIISPVDSFYSTYEELKQDISSGIVKGLKGFYSTYEELKLCHGHWNIRHKNCFYSTYEELKLDLSFLEGILSICFYSTYEELKHLNSTSTLSNFFSFYSTYEELKLRIWCRLILWIRKFLQYLWGIETPNEYIYRVDYPTFLQYLWGIETSFQLNYILFPGQFLQYLWGIETNEHGCQV